MGFVSHGQKNVSIKGVEQPAETLAMQMTRQQKEAKWLAENRARYAGLWIALDGDKLLAVSRSSKEVFASGG